MVAEMTPFNDDNSLKSFSDADLKRMRKEMTTPNLRNIAEIYKLNALLARLEAVERYATYMRTKHPGWYNPQYEAWRKASGK
jgi:hypothetical protein